MKQKEQKVWDALKRNANRTLKLQRVENVLTDGMPDVYSVGRGLWIEMKAPEAKVKETTPVLGTEGLRISQINWIIDAVMSGRKVYILIRDTAGKMWLIEGKHAVMINAMPRQALAGCAIATTWDEINEELMR